MSVDTDTATTHRVQWTLTEGYGVEWKFLCDGTSESRCHQGCSSCDEMCHCGEPSLKSFDECLIVTWLSEYDGDCLFEGPEQPVRDAEIAVSWDGENWVWKYAEPEGGLAMSDNETTPDMDALFTTPRIHTDDDGVHRDDAGRVYRAVMVGGETTYELVEVAQDEF